MDAPNFDVKTYPGFVQVSEEMLMDCGVIPDTRPPTVVPWRSRLRWRWQAWRERTGRTVGTWIAGTDITRGEDW
jgi:hypothetical protein